MPTLTTKEGTIFNYNDNIEGEVAIVAKGQPVVKLQAADLLEFAEYLFEKARYETVIRMRIKEGDVLLVRAPVMSMQASANLEKQVMKGILEPMGLAGKVQVVVLDGSLDIEVVTQE